MILVPAYLGGLLVSALLAIAIDIWVRRNGQGTPARWFRVPLYCAVVWATGSAAQLLVSGQTAKVALLQVWAVAAWGVPLSWFVFVVFYTGNEHHLTRGVTFVVGGLFAVLAGLSLTNHVHGLLWSGTRVVTDGYAVPVLAVERTTVYWLGLLASYAFVVVSILLLFRLLLTSRRVGRGQVMALSAGVVLPIGLNLLSVSTAQHAPALNLTPVGVGLFLVFVGWALFRYQLFGIEPQARARVLEVIDEGVIVVDGDGRVVDFNDRATALFPTLADGFGDLLTVVVPPLLADETATGEDRFADSLSVDTPTGERAIQVSVSELAVGGDRDGTVLVCQDVTELRTYATELEQRTDQLDQFAETVSHDLRNPLAVVQSHLELIEATGETDRVPEAMAATERMETIIADVLTLAREGDGIEEVSPTSLAAVANAAWGTTDAPRVSLDVTVPEDCHVEANGDRLRTVLENLFRNAAEHATPDGDARARGDGGGGPQVTITVARTDDGFAILDNGPGIPESERDAVFEQGYTTASDGTGFGLAIVQDVARAHGWTVSVTSSASGGAQFTFEDVSFVDGPG